MSNAKSDTKRNYLIIWLIFICVLVGIDQLTKHIFKSILDGKSGIIIIRNVLELQYVENRGMAFGMLQGRRILFILLCIIFCAVLIWLFLKLPKTTYFAPLIITGGIIAGGAVGNFIDRAVRGYVVDFIYFSLIDFPVFNVADIYVVCGAVLLVILIIFYYKDDDFSFLKSKR